MEEAFWQQQHVRASMVINFACWELGNNVVRSSHLVSKLLNEDEGANENVGIHHVMLEGLEVLLIPKLLNQVPNNLQSPASPSFPCCLALPRRKISSTGMPCCIAYVNQSWRITAEGMRSSKFCQPLERCSSVQLAIC